MDQLLDQNLMKVHMSDDGSEVEVTLVDAGLAACKRVLRCKEVIVFEFHRTLPDTTPYIIPEVTWRRVGVEAIPQLLEEHAYSFRAWDGTVWCPFSQPLIHVKFEGAVCVEIVCVDLNVLESQ